MRMQTRKFSCSVCGNGVGRNSLLGTKCQRWVHKKCSGIQGKVASINGFVCKRCLGLVVTSMEENITSDEDNVEIVNKFAHLGDVLSTEEELKKLRVQGYGWMKFKEVSSVLGNKYMSLKIREALYKSALTYGGECWALRKEDERRLITTEIRMLHLICGKTFKYKITNEKVRELTGVDEMKEFMRGQRLRWLGHVERMDENRGPANALHFRMDGSKKGRPKNSW